MSQINVGSITIRPKQAASSGVEAFLDAFTSYLEFLKVLPHISPSQITYPPESGWPDFSVTEQQLRRLGKSDAVINLLRNIPQTRGIIAGSYTIQLAWHDEDRLIQDLAEQDDSELQARFNGSVGNPMESDLGPDQITVTFGGEEEISLVVNCATGKWSI